MKTISILQCAAIAIALSQLTSPVAAMAVQQSKFDGVYAVDVVTSQGSCDKYHWTVAVANGHVSSTASGFIQIVGLVDRRGAVSLIFRGQSQLARAGGHMNGTRGGGTWSSPTLACGGTWHAQRAG